MDWQEHIVRRPEVMGGKPVIKGTRITVELILERLGDGWKEEDLLKSHPHLAADHIRAAQAFAATSFAHDDCPVPARDRRAGESGGTMPP